MYGSHSSLIGPSSSSISTTRSEKAPQTLCDSLRSEKPKVRIPVTGKLFVAKRNIWDGRMGNWGPRRLRDFLNLHSLLEVCSQVCQRDLTADNPQLSKEIKTHSQMFRLSICSCSVDLKSVTSCSQLQRACRGEREYLPSITSHPSTYPPSICVSSLPQSSIICLSSYLSSVHYLSICHLPVYLSIICPSLINLLSTFY